MTTDKKEKFIRFCRSKKVDKAIYAYEGVILVLLILSYFLKANILNFKLLLIVVIPVIIIKYMREAVAKRRDEVIYNNNLLYIILSNITFVEELFFLLIVIGFILIKTPTINIGFIPCLLIGVVLAIIIMIISNIICKYFEGKLSE